MGVWTEGSRCGITKMCGHTGVGGRGGALMLRLAWMFCCVVTALLQKEGVVGQTLSPEKKAKLFLDEMIKMKFWLTF